MAISPVSYVIRKEKATLPFGKVANTNVVLTSKSSYPIALETVRTHSRNGGSAMADFIECMNSRMDPDCHLASKIRHFFTPVKLKSIELFSCGLNGSMDGAS